METFSEFSFPLKRRNKTLVAIPASFVSDVPHLREKTFRIGLIGRALAIFRVDEVVVYPDFRQTDQKWDINLIASILNYMETPQYLRKRLFKIQPGLKYAGVLPPLRTPHHPLADRIRDLKAEEFREGVVLAHSAEGTQIDVGVELPVLIQGARMKLNERVTVKIVELGKHPKAVRVDPEVIKAYWGFKVTGSKHPFGQFVKNADFDLVVATSRKGTPITAVLGELTKRWKQSDKTLIAFGAPTQGLFEIAAKEGFKLEDLADFTVNTIPNQGTETVRTEEAICASLALLNILEQ